MDEKKGIGLKIWDLFLKKYSYGAIAKELGISKSVVSNVINYCLPPNENSIQEDIKNFKKELEEELIKCKETCEKDINSYKEKTQQLKNKNNKLKEELEELEEEVFKTKITSIFITFFTTLIILRLFYNFLFNQNFLIKLIALFLAFLLVITISFLATTLIKRFIL